MRIAYADPVYLGQARHYRKHHPDANRWDDPRAHADLVVQLVEEYPDGWALTCSSTSLQTILSFCPPAVRVSSWCKPFAIFKPGVNPAYCWEPLIWTGGRPRGRDLPTVRDFLVEPITLRRGLVGAKPEAFAVWLFELLGMQPQDEFVDLFPGTGVMSRTWEKWRRSWYRNQAASPGRRRLTAASIARTRSSSARC